MAGRQDSSVQSRSVIVKSSRDMYNTRVQFRQGLRRFAGSLRWLGLSSFWLGRALRGLYLRGDAFLSLRLETEQISTYTVVDSFVNARIESATELQNARET